MVALEVRLKGGFTAEFLPSSASGFSRLKHSEGCEGAATQFL